MSPLENKAHKGWLMSGAGNTFAIGITAQNDKLTNIQAKAICEQFKVDGYLGLIERNPNEFDWNFFNSDGSVAEFCGNAARCAQSFLKEQKASIHSKHHTVAGTVLSWTDKAENWVLMPKPEILETEKSISLSEGKWTGLWCNTGVPHFVLAQPKLRHDVWLEISKKLRKHQDFGTSGANITWVQKSGDKVIAVTYERGVEDFTQACGTGAMAATLWWKNLDPSRKEFEISMPGGALRIILNESGWMMTGPVEKLGDWSIS